MQHLILMFLHDIINLFRVGGSELYGILMKTFLLTSDSPAKNGRTVTRENLSINRSDGSKPSPSQKSTGRVVVPIYPLTFSKFSWPVRHPRVLTASSTDS